jgi:uncharacterized membrane protein YphA (DoxX/SURF4 family)
MNNALWIVQTVLALAFLMAGTMKTFQPLDKAAKSLGWVKDVPASLVRFIGLSELLAALGLVLPAVTGIMPWLTPLAGVGLVIVMISASVSHASRREYQTIAFNFVILVLAAFVAYGRFAVVPA